MLQEPCPCELCTTAVAEGRVVRDNGTCHGYDGDEPCNRSAMFGSLLCLVCNGRNTPSVRSLCRDMAPRGAR